MITFDESTAGLRLARAAIVASLPGRERFDPEALVRASSLPPLFAHPRGVFVTLKEHPDGALRGCIGYPLPRYPLGLAIARIAPAAAFDDPRFPPVRAAELDGLRIELSILTVPEPIDDPDPADRLARVRVGIDGLILEVGDAAGLLLPQVAPDQGWDAPAFLAGLCEKAGVADDAWRRPDARLYRFQADVVGERAPGVVGG